MTLSVSSPDFDSLAISGFLGFPSGSESTIPLDGDIVLLTGPNGAGKSSLLEAIALHETGGTFRDGYPQFKHIGKNDAPGYQLRFKSSKAPHLAPIISDRGGYPVSGQPWWSPEFNQRQRHVRTVYFHPHYLGNLFEENPETIATSFVDLLAPAPVAVDELRKALKESIPHIEQTIARLEREAGFTSEAQKAEERRNFASRLNMCVASLRENFPALGMWLNDFSVERLVIRSGNLRSTWQSELANLAQQILVKFPAVAETSSASEISLPPESLLIIARVSRYVASEQSPESEAIARQAIPVEALLSTLRTLSGAGWQALRDTINGNPPDELGQKFTRTQLAERRDKVRRLRQTLGHGSENFGKWTTDFQQRASQWRDSLPIGETSDINCPGEIQEWIRQANQLAESWCKVVPIWNEWTSYLEDQEKSFSHQLEGMERAAQEHRDIKKIAPALATLLDQHPNVRGLLSDEKSSNQLLAVLSEFREQNSTSTTTSLARLALNLAEACETWASREKAYVHEDERRTKDIDQGAAQKLDDLRALCEAINLESGTSAKARLGQLQQEALTGSLKPIETFLNETAERFRIFENITPIRLSRLGKSKTGARLALQVGEPSRDVSQTSSGQRSQVGLLMFLALHYGLRTTYPGRVICLDEITSSFDLGQLPRLALLMRQIAYAPSTSPFRRRIFLASHNEEFSQRLAELLTPPEGNSLRILRFTGYDSTAGPTIEPYLQHPAAPFDIKQLAGYFQQRYNAATA